MIYFLGDIHGYVPTMFIQRMNEGDSVVQVGDFGILDPRKPSDIKNLSKTCVENGVNLYFIAGNHEYYPLIDPMRGGTMPVHVEDNVFFCPNGSITQIEGKTIGFLGGAASIDYKWRRKDVDIWDSENIYEEEFQTALGWPQIDVMVTHTPPQEIIDKCFDPFGKLMFNVPISWTDPNAGKVQEVWEKQGRVPLVCGHMHKSIERLTCRILNINEMITVDELPPRLDNDTTTE